MGSFVLIALWMQRSIHGPPDRCHPPVAALNAVYPNKHLHRPGLDGATGP
jgi:hypothetical protein